MRLEGSIAYGRVCVHDSRPESAMTQRIRWVRSHWRELVAPLGLALVLLFCLVLKFRLNRVLNLNWDEFHFLSKIYIHDRGELGDRFMTLHVHLFGWLRWVSDNEVDQLMAARTTMFLARLGTCVGLFLLGRRLMGATGALFGIIVGLVFGFVMRHGETFRFDPMLAFAFVLAATLLVLRMHSRIAIIVAGLAIAVAAMISIKIVFFAPTVFVIFAATWWHSSERKLIAMQFGLFALVTFVGFGLLYVAHAATLAEHVGPSSGQGFLERAMDRMLVWDENFPQLDTFIDTLHWDGTVWFMIFLGGAIAIGDVLHLEGEERVRAVILVSLLIPVGSLVIYRNAFAYFYVTVIPPAALVAGLVAARIVERLRSRPLIAALLVGLVAYPVAKKAWKFHEFNKQDEVTKQRMVLAGIHQMFPEPVPFIDRCNMVASYPMVGPFMSTIVMEHYREAGEPQMKRILAEKQPKFVLANVGSLELSRRYGRVDSDRRLLKADYNALQGNFIRHWGPVWVAGWKRKAVGRIPVKVHILIEGTYTVEGVAPVEIDGKVYEPGQTLVLVGGEHRVRSAGKKQKITLRYGDNLVKPKLKLPKGPIFRTLRFEMEE